MGSENAHGCPQNSENGFGFNFDFLERCHKDGVEFLNHTVRVTGGETCVSFVNVETKSSQSIGCSHICTTDMPKNSNKRLPIKLMATVFWDRKRSADGGIHAKRDHNNARSVCDTLKILHRAGHSEKRDGMLTYGVVLLHDISCLHTAART
jgi:hypothetical protein